MPSPEISISDIQGFIPDIRTVGIITSCYELDLVREGDVQDIDLGPRGSLILARQARNYGTGGGFTSSGNIDYRPVGHTDFSLESANLGWTPQFSRFPMRVAAVRSVPPVQASGSRITVLWVAPG